jgi:mRNA interferase YafQ
MRTIDRSTAFRRDYKRVRASSRYRDIDARLNAILELLAADEPLPPSNRDHALTGDWVGYRECHVRPDLLLIYHKHDQDGLRLARLGSHSELFR